MPDTGSEMSRTERVEETHGESHASMSARKSRGKSRVDATSVFPQVRNSRGAEEKVTRPLPRKVTFSGLSIGRPERDPRGGRDQQNPSGGGDPEPVGPIAEKVLDRLAAASDDDDLAARRREAMRRLTRAHHTSPLTRKEKP